MAIKMRVLYLSNKGKIVSAANYIKEAMGLDPNRIDTIPPAYSCDKERLVVLCLSLNGDPSDKLRLFCRELTTQRAQNVALVIDGKEADAAKIISVLKEAGTNVLSNVLYINGGIPFLKKLSDAEKASISSWMNNVVDNIG